MYNSINPINITYRKPNQSQWAAAAYGANNSESAVNPDAKGQRQQQEFPNGAKVAIDYSKNTINISQIVTDFKSTILAINAPDDITDEVNSYLSLVEKESKKSNPSKDIIVSNLKNASRISDAYIAQSLNKPSKVVEGWIDALFMQNIELKANPDHINPDFQLDIPDKKQKNPAPETPVEQQAPTPEPEIKEEPRVVINQETPAPIAQEEIETTPLIEAVSEEPPRLELIDNTPAVSLDNREAAPVKEETKPRPKYVTTPKDASLARSLKEAKKLVNEKDDPASALETLNNALGEADENTNENLRAALHFERGKIFDDYDYVNYALRDYYEATKCEDDNLKSQAHFKMARIYDDYVEFEPALEHYQDAVGYSAEADNLRAQAKILNEMSSMFAGRYDYDSTHMLSNLALEAAKNTNDDILISQAYSNAARNYEYLGEDFMALDNYKYALKAVNNTPEDADLFEMRAQNYEDAADIMDRLGNSSKAESLLSKARLCRQRAQFFGMSEAG